MHETVAVTDVEGCDNVHGVCFDGMRILGQLHSDWRLWAYIS